MKRSKIRDLGSSLRYFSPKTVSFWTSVISVFGIFVPNKHVRLVSGYAGLVCGLGGAGMVYERIAEREGCPREPVHVAMKATKDEHASVWLHLVFGGVGLMAVYKALQGHP